MAKGMAMRRAPEVTVDAKNSPVSIGSSGVGGSERAPAVRGDYDPVSGHSPQPRVSVGALGRCYGEDLRRSCPSGSRSRRRPRSSGRPVGFDACGLRRVGEGGELNHGA
jgi:hypothetical protein